MLVYSASFSEQCRQTTEPRRPFFGEASMSFCRQSAEHHRLLIEANAPPQYKFFCHRPDNHSRKHQRPPFFSAVFRPLALSSSSSSFSPLLLIRAVGYVMRRYRQSPETGTQRPRKNATDSENRYQMKRLRAKCRSASEAASRRNRRKRNTENLIYGQAPRPSTDEIFWPQGVEGGARGECGRERRFGQPRI